MNSGRFVKGRLPHNKGKESEHKLKKLQRFEQGLPIFCKHHGEHTNWRLHSGNNVQCKYCSKMWAQNRRKSRISEFRVSDAKRHAKIKQIDFDITENDILELLIAQENKCALSRIEFKDGNYSIDRINPNIGYIKSNIQLVLFEVNRMKSDIALDRFLELCCEIAYSVVGKSKAKKGKK